MAVILQLLKSAVDTPSKLIAENVMSKIGDKVTEKLFKSESDLISKVIQVALVVVTGLALTAGLIALGGFTPVGLGVTVLAVAVVPTFCAFIVKHIVSPEKTDDES